MEMGEKNKIEGKQHESEGECESALLTELFASLVTCCRNWFVVFQE